MLSYQSPMPAGAGTPRYERPELPFHEANSHRAFCHAHSPPQRGTSPRATFPRPTPLDSGLRRGMTIWGGGNGHPGSGSGTYFRGFDDMRFADYRNGFAGLIVSTNCLSAWEYAPKVLNIRE